MGKLLRSLAEENAISVNKAADEYTRSLFATMINPDMPMRYAPPQRNISRKVPFRKYFHYF